MSFADIVRSGVATARELSDSLLVDVQHQAWIGLTSFGAPNYAAAVTRRALVEMKQRQVKMPNGEVAVSRAQVTFIEPLPANGAANRREPIDLRDNITLPDGTSGPILDVSGLFDPETNAPYMLQVFLG